MTTTSHTRRTSPYTLRVHGTDALLDLTRLVSAVTSVLPLTDQHTNREDTYISVGYRATGDAEALLYADTFVAAAGLHHQGWSLYTGYGVHRRFVGEGGSVQRITYSDGDQQVVINLPRGGPTP